VVLSMFTSFVLVQVDVGGSVGDPADTIVLPVKFASPSSCASAVPVSPAVASKVTLNTIANSVPGRLLVGLISLP
jgi:hypothetical protein